MSFGSWLAKQLEDEDNAANYSEAQVELQYEIALALAQEPLRFATATTVGTPIEEPIRGTHQFEIRLSDVVGASA